MAISANTVFEVRTGGSDNSGGAFVAGAAGTDRSQADAAFASGSNLTVDATTNTDVAPDGYTCVSADVGNLIQITAGAGFTIGFYQIASIQSSKWRLDRSPAATTTAGGTWALGGGLATPGKAGGAAAGGNTIWIRGAADPESVPYLLSNTSNVAGGRVTISAALHIRGYLTTRGDCTVGGLRPVLKADANSVVCLTCSSSNSQVSDLVCDGAKASRTSTVGVGGSSSVAAFNVTCRNCSSNGFSNSSLLASMCSATANTGNGFSTFRGLDHCVALSNVAGGIYQNGAGNITNCVVASNTGIGIDCDSGCIIDGCTVYGNGSDGIECSAGAVNTIVNTIIYGNTGVGLRGPSSGPTVFGWNNAFGANSAPTAGTVTSTGTITLSATPFTNAAGADFSLNNTAGGGALLRALAFPAAFPGLSTNNYRDVGAQQHQSAAAGGGGSPSLSGGITQ